MAKKPSVDLEEKIRYLEKSLADSHGLYGIRIAELNRSIAEKNRAIDWLTNELANIKVQLMEISAALLRYRDVAKEVLLDKVKEDAGV